MALITYIRVSDNLKLVRDKNLEVTDLLYIPVADSFGDLGIGDGDPAKPGAVAAYMDGDDVKLAIYQGDGTWEPVGADPTIPTLQEVTDEGNVTTNIIETSGYNISDPNRPVRIYLDQSSDGLYIQQNRLPAAGSGIQSLIAFNAPANNDITISNKGPDTSSIGTTIGVTPNGIVRVYTNAGSSTFANVRGADALSDDDFVTKRQLDAGAPTYTPDPSLPDPPTKSYLNTNYPSAKVGDVVYWEGTTQVVEAKCYAVGEWNYSTKNRAQ